MITYPCQHCQKPLEVDDELAGKKAACPHCGLISDVPLRSAAASEFPPARPAAPAPIPLASPSAPSGPAGPAGERQVLSVHPVLFRARPARAVLILGLLVAGVVGVGYALFTKGHEWVAWPGGAAIVASLGWWAVWAIQSHSVALIVTTKRVTQRRGLLSRQTEEIPHDKIQDLQVTQSFSQRLMRVGTLGISNAGETGTEIVVHDLPDPMKIRQIIDAYRDLG